MRGEAKMMKIKSNDFADPVIIYSAAGGFKDKPGGFVWSWTD